MNVLYQVSRELWRNMILEMFEANPQNPPCVKLKAEFMHLTVEGAEAKGQ